jgi:hypothetical protein
MNDFQFMPKSWNNWLGFNSFLVCAFFHVDCPSRYTHYMAQQNKSEAYNTVNQVGEMFANYNLIAAIASFIATIGKIYESKIHTLCRTCLRRTWSYVCLFHNWTTVIIHYGFQWWLVLVHRLGKYFIYTAIRLIFYNGLLHGVFKLLYSNPS